ncbi:MAG: antibiotic biosynthesis monooxygenase family protein [Bacteroidota bacterium]
MPPFKRIVKMTFRPEEVDSFLEVFAAASTQIRAFPGCLHLELWRGQRQPNVLFTFSRWENEDALENYRHSELFRSTWAKTKPLFAEKAAAWSVDTLAEL